MISRRAAMGMMALAAAATTAACSKEQEVSDVAEDPTSAPEGTAEESSAMAADQEISFALSNVPDGLDPGVTSNSFASPYLTNLFEGLVSYDIESTLVPGLAESWEISEDGLVYTFTLREGLKWSDGDPLTAADFEYSWRRLLDPETSAQYVNMMTDYVEGAAEIYDGGDGDLGVKAIDDTTLEVTLMKPASQFLGVLSMWTFVPVKQDAVEAGGASWTRDPETFVTSGPFKPTKIADDEFVMEKNENYWDAENVPLTKITLPMIKDLTTALNAFQSGEVDGARNVPLADFATLKANEPQFHIIPSYAVTYYNINCEKEPYNDPRVRQALNLAIDRQAIIENVLKSTDEPAFSLVAPGYSYDGGVYEEGRGDYGMQATADVEKAKELLAEAGYPDGQGFPPMELYYYTDDSIKLVAEAMAEMFTNNLGIEVSTPTKEWGVYYTDVQNGDYQVAAMGWGADYLHPMTFFGQFVTGSATNNSFYSNPEYDELVSQASAEPDAAKQVELLREAEDLLMADYPALPLYYRSTSLLMSDKVKDWYMTPLSALFLKNASLSE